MQVKNYTLNPESIDEASDDIYNFLVSLNINKKLCIKDRLLAEEILNGWLEKESIEKFTVTTGTRLRKHYLSIEAEGMPANILEKGKADEFFMVQHIMNDMGYAPSFSYKNGKNIFRFDLPSKQRNPIFILIFAILVGVVLGAFIRGVFAEETVSTFLTCVIDPLYATAFRLLTCISGPMILLSVMWGIYGIGDVAVLQTVGRKTMGRFVLSTFAIVIASAMIFPIFNFTLTGGQQNGSAFNDIYMMILDVVPDNIFSPFISGNTLQIIFSAIIMGIAMLFLGKKVNAVADLVEQLNYIIQFMMAFISKIMPALVFLIMFRMVLNDSFRLLISLWKLLVIFIAMLIVVSAFFTIVTSIKHKVSPVIIVKKSIPTFIIAITTASSAAAFDVNMQTSQHKFGIDKSLCAFGIPLGMVMFKTGSSIYYVLICLFFADMYDVDVSASWLLTVIFMAAMLSIAAPAVPGGGVAIYTLLFNKLMLPDEALALVLAIDLFMDFLITAGNMYNLPLSLIATASSIGKLDEDVLRHRAGDVSAH